MNSNLGVAYGLLAAGSYGLMSFLVHLNPRSFPVEQLLFIRGAIAVLCLLPFCRGDLVFYIRRGSRNLWIRSLAGAIAVTFYYYTLQGTSSANANLLFSGSPIFVALLAWWLLGEKLKFYEVMGILLIVLGNFLLYLPNRDQIPIWVWATGLFGAAFAGVSFLSLGAASRKYSSALIVFGFSAASAVLALVLPGKSWLTIEPSDILFLAAASGLGLLSQLAATVSFAHLKSSVASAIGRTSILFSGLLDVSFGSHKIHWLEWIAYLVVLLGVSLAPGKKSSINQRIK